jgi:hypothetical protein
MRASQGDLGGTMTEVEVHEAGPPVRVNGFWVNPERRCA